MRGGKQAPSAGMKRSKQRETWPLVLDPGRPSPALRLHSNNPNPEHDWCPQGRGAQHTENVSRRKKWKQEQQGERTRKDVRNFVETRTEAVSSIKRWHCRKPRENLQILRSKTFAQISGALQGSTTLYHYLKGMNACTHARTHTRVTILHSTGGI